MSNDTTFTEGFIFKAPHQNAPDFVKHSVSIKLEEFIPWLQNNAHNGWVNIDIKESKNGKLYSALNTYGRDNQKSGDQSGYSGYGQNQGNPPSQNKQQEFASYTPPSQPAKDDYEDDIPF